MILKTILDCKNYKTFKDFNTRVLKTAVAEINKYTYLKISYEYVKERQKVVAIKFKMGIKDFEEQWETKQLKADF